jgi:hypothetical protein
MRLFAKRHSQPFYSMDQQKASNQQQKKQPIKKGGAPLLQETKKSRSIIYLF